MAYMPPETSSMACMNAERDCEADRKGSFPNINCHYAVHNNTSADVQNSKDALLNNGFARTGICVLRMRQLKTNRESAHNPVDKDGRENCSGQVAYKQSPAQSRIAEPFVGGIEDEHRAERPCKRSKRKQYLRRHGLTIDTEHRSAGRRTAEQTKKDRNA